MMKIAYPWSAAGVVLSLLFATPAWTAECNCADVSREQVDTLPEAALKQCVIDLGSEIRNQKMEAAQRSRCEGILNHAFLRQRWIESLPQAEEYLLVNHDDFDDYFFAFSVGYEYSGVSEIFSKGFPRVGLLVHRKYHERLSMAGSFLLTSSAEQKLEGTGQASDIRAEGEKTLELEVQPFYAWKEIDAVLGRGSRKINEQIGATLVLGGRKTDQTSQLDARYYLGLRAAFNPHTYFDALVGRTQSLDSSRLELRGQMPIFRMANNSRFYIGGILNAAVHNRDEVTEPDVVRVYVKWDSPDLSNIF